MATMAKAPTNESAARPLDVTTHSSTRPYLVKARSSAVRELRANTLHQDSLAMVQVLEGEDGQITGLTRSLHRRLLALNVHGRLKPKPAAGVANPVAHASVHISGPGSLSA